MGKISDAIERHQKETAAPQPVPPPEPPRERPPKPHRAPRKKRVDPGIRAGGFNPKLVVAAAPGSMDAEQFKVLRRQIIFSKREPKPRIILVTSALPGEGKTYVAANLAASIAQSIDHYVLLMDADMRQPTLHTLLGMPNREGLREYLTDHRPLPELLNHTRIDRLTFISAGSLPPNPSELMSSNVMKECLQELKERYQDRYIVIDTTPTQLTSEASALVNYVDGIVLVIMARKTPREAAQKCVEQMDRDKVLGVVFNDYATEESTTMKYHGKYFR